MRLKIIISLCIFAVIALAGCAQKDKLIGSWTGKWQVVDIVQTFEADGTYKTSGVISAPSGGKSINIEMSGTYKHDGDKVTFTPIKFDMPGVDPAIKGMVEAQAKDKMMKPETATLKWISDDQFEISGGNNNATMTRKK
jgi:hypothetical protein